MSYYYTAYGLLISSEIALPPLKEIKPGPVDIVIKRGKLPESPPLQSTKIHRAGLQATFAQDGPQRCWLNWAPLLSFMAVDGQELFLDTTQTDEDVLSLFTLSEALGLILFQRGYFLLHGSAIQLNNKGIVFLGEPGAGKSTTVAAFAQQGVSVISDDMVCIWIDEAGQPFLLPAFPQIKIWENTVNGLQLTKHELTPVREGVNKFSWHQPDFFDDKAVPLDRIFVLTSPQEGDTDITQLPKHQIPVELLGYFSLADSLLQGEPLKDYFTKSVTLAHTVPLFKMSRPADFTKLYAFVDYLKTVF